MIRLFYFTLALLLFQSPARAGSAKNHEFKNHEFMVLTETTSKDLFSILNSVCRMIIYYEKGLSSGAEVDFHKYGAFSKANHGENWWNYYFAPIFIGNPDDAVPFAYDDRTLNNVTSVIASACTQETLQRIVKKYIRIKPHIRKKVQQVYTRELKNRPTIGIHFQESSKKGVKPISYEKIAQSIDHYVEENKLRNYQIFVSTNSQTFLEVMRMRFPTRIFSLPKARFNQNKSPYLQSEKDLLECLLLAKLDVMIYAPSEMSRWIFAFNPSINALEVEKDAMDYWKWK